MVSAEPTPEIRRVAGRLVRDARTRRNMSIEAIAKASGSSHTTWRLIERGDEQVRPQSYGAVDKAFDMTPGTTWAAISGPPNLLILVEPLGVPSKVIDDFNAAQAGQLLGAAIRRRREELDLEQDELGELTGSMYLQGDGIAHVEKTGEPMYGSMDRTWPYRVEVALGWAEGSVDAVRKGGSPTLWQAPAGVSVDDEAAARLTRAMAGVNDPMYGYGAVHHPDGTIGPGPVGASEPDAPVPVAPTPENANTGEFAAWGPIPLRNAVSNVGVTLALLANVENPDAKRVLEARKLMRQAMNLLFDEIDENPQSRND